MKSLKQNKTHVKLNLSLVSRFWLFQLVVVLVILTCIFLTAGFSGVISDLAENPYHDVIHDLQYIESEISKKCLIISNTTIELSDRINKSINRQLQQAGISHSDIKNHPELIETILSNEVEKSRFAMEKAGVTGVFLFLDATVNPALERANDSKAGFYLVNMNHEPVPYESQQLFLLYGPVKLARENNMHLHTQWELEFDISPDIPKRRRDLFRMPYDAALSGSEQNTYYLGYWNPLFIPAENTDNVLSYSVPLLDNDGNPYGICGLEISKTAFESILRQKSSYEFGREVILFSTRIGDGIDMDNALVLGMNTSWLINGDSKYLYISPHSEDNKLNDYYFTKPSSETILGYDIDVRIYPKKSTFSDAKWSLAILIPKSDVTSKSARLYYILFVMLLLLAISVVITFFTSKYCISPILEAIKMIKSNETQGRTNITEIDDLIEFLSMRSEPAKKGIETDLQLAASARSTKHADSTEPSPEHLSPEQYKKFEDQLQTLSNAERRIFDLYIEGYDAKEICNMLYISINTLKTHNRRIYTKMNVSSRAELLKYCNELMGKK